MDIPVANPKKRAMAQLTYITVGLFVILPTLRSRAIRLLQVS